MAATSAIGSSRRSAGNGPVLRSGSQPSGQFNLSAGSSSSSSFASSSSSFASHSSSFFSSTRSTSPTQVNLYSQSSSTRGAPLVRFSFDCLTSPSRSISTVNPSRQHVVKKSSSGTAKRTCMCSPTTHLGSFRCSLHKNFGNPHGDGGYSSNRNNTRLNARRSAMTNSLVRICGVEGDLVKRALVALIRPSSHSQRRRSAFQSRPSRLSVMSKAEDDS